MQPVGAGQPRSVGQPVVDPRQVARVGGEGARPRRDQRHHRAAVPVVRLGIQLDPTGRQLPVDHLADRIGGSRPEQPGATAQGTHPRSDVGGLPARAQRDGCRRVVIGRQGSLRRDEDIEHDVTGHAHQH